MTPDTPLSPTRKFVPALLPWLVGAGAMLVYVLTLNRWVSLGGVMQMAKASGWSWQPEPYQPLNWLLTTACHLLPVKLVPLALNVFSAVCAALTLTLLARSVALLPRDRTEEQRQRERSPFSLLSIPLAWLPVLLAVLLCGLELTFWENATAPSNYQPPFQGGSEMLDLLLFAYVIRCLLEFRIDERESWLTRASLVFGLAMTNNWAMIAFFPLFLVALVWLVGLRFFNVRFLTRMFVWGFAGLLFYLLLPLTQSLANSASFSFWQLLKQNLVAQKSALFFLPFNKAALVNGLDSDQGLWVLGLPSLLPVLVLAIRWPSYFGDPSKLGVTLTTLVFHIFHAFLLLICVWIALDPQVSPRHLLPGVAMLPLYYLGALSVGYYSGYFLLVFRPRPGPRSRPSPLLRLLNSLAVSAAWLLLLAAPALLLYQNLPQIRRTNGSFLRQYASLQLHNLPRKHAVLLSDDPRALFLLQAAAAQAGVSKDYVFVNTESLPLPEYHRYLKQHYPERWPAKPPEEGVRHFEEMPLLREMMLLNNSNQLFYLQPSFGYYFEAFYQEPHGLCYQLNRYPDNALLAPLPDPKLIQENEAFWNDAHKAELQPLLAAISPPPSSEPAAFPQNVIAWVSSHLHLVTPKDANLPFLAGWYSRALNFWGVELQKAGQLSPAAQRFAQALALNSDNRAAEFNRDANAALQSGHKLAVLEPKDLEERFGKYRSLNPLLHENGPFDEPTLCFVQAQFFYQAGILRQSVQYLARTAALAPDHLVSRVLLAGLYANLRRPDEALAVIHQIRTNTELAAASAPYQFSLLKSETTAYLAKHDNVGADAAVRTALRSNTNDFDLLQLATQVYVNGGSFSNALGVVERELQLAPTNLDCLVNKGWLLLQTGAYDRAIPVLTKALDTETNLDSPSYNSALLDRAIAYLRRGQLDAAEHDYHVFQKTYPNAREGFYGLGEIAYRKKDTNTAIQCFQLYLTNSPPGDMQTNLVLARLKELRPGSP